MLKSSPNLDSLYCLEEDGSRKKIHTADVKGRYQVRKRLIWVVLLAIYVVLPWIKVGGQPAVLLDIVQRHFYLFGFSFNAQDFYLAFFLVSGLGFGLFVLSSMYGRVWCGYACPHTVFLEGVFRRVERWIDGTAQQQERLEKAGWTLGKILRRVLKYGAFVGISLFLSHTFLSYFMGVEQVYAAVTHAPSVHPTAFTFVMVFTAIIYFNFTWFREQLCIVICPYGRLQSVMYDEHTVNVGYDAKRGEPRGKYTKADRGACIDCHRCVAVCPTAIDIRNGTQLECVGCSNCIDACDEVMDKVGQPRGLIRYDSMAGFEGKSRRFFRPRIAFYGFLLLLGMGVFTTAASFRTDYESNLTRLPGIPYQIDNEVVTNDFILHLINKQSATMSFKLEAEPGQAMSINIPVSKLDLEPMADSKLRIQVKVPVEDFRPGEKVKLILRSGEEERLLEGRFLGPGR